MNRPDRTKTIEQNGKTYQYEYSDEFIIAGQIWERDVWLCIGDERPRPYKSDKRLMFSEPSGRYIANK